MRKYNLQKYTLLLILTALFLTKGQGQDSRFAQFYNTPMNINPALTGVINGQFRLAANYRNLYSTVLAKDSYRTFSASFDAKYHVLRNDFLGLGFTAIRDEVGQANFTRTKANFTASFQKYLGGTGRYSRGSQYLSGGFQLGLGQYGYKGNGLWFSKQFEYGSDFAQINYDAPTGEELSLEQTRLFFDFNAGLLWYAVFDKEKSIYFGGSIYHLTKPNIGFLTNSSTQLNQRLVLHAGGQFPVTDDISLLPAAIFMTQGAATSASGGLNIRYSGREWKEVAIRAGLWAHLSNHEKSMVVEAVTVSSILEFDRIKIGVSYDITVSILKAATNSRGAFEFSLIYTQPAKARRLRTVCPGF